MNNEDFKYLLKKLDELPNNIQLEILNNHTTKDNVYQLMMPLNFECKSNSIKDVLIEEYLKKCNKKLSVALEILNVHFHKYYDTYIIENEICNDDLYLKMMNCNIFVPEKYLNFSSETIITALLNNKIKYYNLPENKLNDIMCAELYFTLGLFEINSNYYINEVKLYKFIEKYSPNYKTETINLLKHLIIIKKGQLDDINHQKYLEEIKNDTYIQFIRKYIKNN